MELRPRLKQAMYHEKFKSNFQILRATLFQKLPYAVVKFNIARYVFSRCVTLWNKYNHALTGSSKENPIAIFCNIKTFIFTPVRTMQFICGPIAQDVLQENLKLFEN